MATVLIGLGSNLGNRKQNISLALKEIGLIRGTAIRKVSGFYATSPLGGPKGQPDFLNAAAVLSYSGTPAGLLKALKVIEKKLGRKKTVRWGPRIIDIDILLSENKIVHSRQLTVPHKLMHKRLFVLKPLAEIAPDAMHPVLKTSVKDMLKNIMPEIFKNVRDVKKFVHKARAAGKSVALVPTMGALHEGHLSLIRQAKKENDIAIVSVFVNPLQFGPKEDFKKYPRDTQRDVELCANAGADAVFAPVPKEIYANDFQTIVSQKRLPEHLCGLSRPGHFTGVMTVCCKLFNIVEPDTAYFGRKDFQQTVVIKKMVEDLNMNLKIKVLPTVREKDGLAMSSRNAYLSVQERRDALCLYAALTKAKQMLKSGERSSAKIIAEMKKIITKTPSAEIDYITVVAPETLENTDVIRGRTVAAMAVRIGKIRLIDNCILKS
ncbi:MAG: pantoate--beta-alanine ligase [Planctomycetes bacterium]|nr:pantoate--beta-alanine ligase [Planctomycetota bacterium]